MCTATAALTPTQMFALSTSLSAGQAAMQYGAGHQSALGQRAYNQRLGQTNALNAGFGKDAYEDHLAALEGRGSEERVSWGQQMEASQRSALQQLGLMTAVGAGRGFGGNSLQALMREVEGQREKDHHTLDLTHQARQRQSRREAKGAYHTLASRILGLPLTPLVTNPSLLASGLKAGAGTLDAYGTYLYRPSFSQDKKV